MKLLGTLAKAGAMFGVLLNKQNPAPDTLNNLDVEPEDPAFQVKLLEIFAVTIDPDVQPAATTTTVVNANNRNEKPLISPTAEYYVAFTHASISGEQESQTAASLPGRAGEKVNVNTHMDLSLGDKLYAEVYRREPFRKDRRVGFVTFWPDELTTKLKRDSVEKRIVDRRTGAETNAKLRLELIRKQWREEYGIPNDRNENKNIDKFFFLNSVAFAKMIVDIKNPTASELTPPTKDADPDLEVVTYLDGLLNMPKYGEFVSLEQHVGWGMNLINKLPFDDRNTPYKSRADGIYKLRRRQLKHCLSEPPEGRWRNPTRDDAMKRVFFSSLGQWFVRKLPDREGYMADTSWLAGLNYRDKYEPLGCKTYFDEQGDIVKIEDPDGTIYKPGEAHWEWAKLKSRSSAFTDASLIHLAQYHYVWGNVPCMALRMFLPPTHPIRRAFTCHYWKTTFTCTQSQWALFDPLGLLSRGLSMTYKGGLEQTFIDMIGNFQFEHFTDDIKKRGMDKCEFHAQAQDGVEFHGIIMQYVADYIDEAYGDNHSKLDNDGPMQNCWKYLVEQLKIPAEENALTIANLKSVWGELIFRVTGGHQSIGAVQQFALDPAFNNVRLEPKENGPSALLGSHESTIGVALVVAMTTLPCPKINQDWSQVLENPASPAYAKLKQNLIAQGQRVDKRNLSRHTCVDFHPAHVAMSISS